MSGPAHVLFVVSYYSPHVGGVEVHVQRLAEAMAARGHRVTVLTSRHDPNLAAQEIIGGVRVIRARGIRAAGGTLMPALALRAIALMWRTDVVSIHVPLLEAPLVSLAGRLLGKRVILRYHNGCARPAGPWHRLVEAAVGASQLVAAAFSHVVVPTTQDYADHSALLARFAGKTHVVEPPVSISAPSGGGHSATVRRLAALGHPLVGMAARISPEKGIEYLLQALPGLLAGHPGLKLVLTGERGPGAGSSAYFELLRPLLDRHHEHIVFTGVLPADELAEFLAAIDVLVVPSVSAAEAFGMVQVEAMLCGTPVVVSDLPGVREPVRRTGMGLLVAPRDVDALRNAVASVLQDPVRFLRPRSEIEMAFDRLRALDAYESLLLPGTKQRSQAPRPTAG